jgi:amino acid transporter
MPFIVVVAQTFCTIASVTSASRMMFAFSRDGAVPGHKLWRRVSKADRVPVYAVWGICVLSFALMIPTLSNAFVGYAVGTQISVIGLYIAFILPVILLEAGSSFQQGAWNLGRYYKLVDWAAIIWVVFIAIAFVLPFASTGVPGNDGFTWDFFNYTGPLVGAAFLLFGGWYVLSARKWFKGPIVQGTEEELRISEGSGPTGYDAGQVARTARRSEERTRSRSFNLRAAGPGPALGVRGRRG